MDNEPVRVKAKGFNLNAADFDKIYEKQGEGKIASHLTDGEHVYFDCSNCGKKLAEVWITQPNFNLTSHIVVECVYCGDKSFKKEVKGAFHIGHTDKTTIDDIDYGLITDEDGKLVQDVVLRVKVG